MPIIFEELSFVYASKTPYEFTALDNVSLTLGDHKIIAIVGATGSGKSTLIQHINGLLIPSKGSINVDGFIIKAKEKKIKKIKDLRKNVGLVFQFPEYQLFEETVESDIMFGPLNFGVKKDQAKALAQKYIKIVGLTEDFLLRSPFNLSGGQKRRVAIAGILALEGNTIILDEPTAGLDPRGENKFIKLFDELKTVENKNIILITHNMNHVLQIADEIVILKEGKLHTQSDPVTVFKNIPLVEATGIELPQIYSFLNHLNQAGIDTATINARNVDTLISQLGTILKKEGTI